MFRCSQDVDSSRSYIDDLYNDNDQNKIVESLVCLKNVVIGSDKQKTLIISQGILPRLMILLSQENTPIPIRYDAAIVLGVSNRFVHHSFAFEWRYFDMFLIETNLYIFLFHRLIVEGLR